MYVPNLAYKVEPLSIYDARIVFEIAHQAFSRSSFENSWSLQAFKETLALPTTQGKLFLVENIPVSYIIYSVIKSFDGQKDAEILSLATHPCGQHKKFMLYLFNNTLQDLTEQCIVDLILDVSTENLKALSLYQKFGFEVIGTRYGYYKNKNGRKEDALVMKKKL